MTRNASPTRMTLVRTLLVAALGLTAGCVLYGEAEEYKSCADVVCGEHASCAEEDATCHCDVGYGGDPYQGCKSAQPEVDPNCDLDCGANAYCSTDGDKQACYCDLDTVAVCGANSGCMPEHRLCDDKQDCPAGEDESPAVCAAPLYQEWLITDACDDGEPIEWKLFALDRDWSWPGGEDVFRTSQLGAYDYQTVQCFEGETICSAAKAGETTWGLQLDGTGSCDTCCFLCGADTTLDIGELTCN